MVARLPRLRQRVAEAPLRLALPEWEDDPHFELDYHAREVILPEPATERHLFDFVGAVFATPLDHLRPLWEAYLIEGLDGGRAACFFKVHHSVMDGVGSLAVFDALTQAHRAEPMRAPRHLPSQPPSSPPVRLARLEFRKAIYVDVTTIPTHLFSQHAWHEVGRKLTAEDMQSLAEQFCRIREAWQRGDRAHEFKPHSEHVQAVEEVLRKGGGADVIYHCAEAGWFSLWEMAKALELGRAQQFLLDVAGSFEDLHVN